MMVIKNIFNTRTAKIKKEIFEELLTTKSFTVERIISQGHSSAKEFWYDQDTNEFVLILQGSAKLRFENGKILNMKKGDYILIPSHIKHRVDWTDPKIKHIG